jgi:metal-responsive CopG/Arc/MetJ family transcriptional regulator
MPRRQVLVQLDDAHVAALDRVAREFDESRSELIRRAIDRYLAAVQESVDDLRYAEAYRRLPEELDEDAGLRALALAAWPDR